MDQVGGSGLWSRCAVQDVLHCAGRSFSKFAVHPNPQPNPNLNPKVCKYVDARGGRIRSIHVSMHMMIQSKASLIVTSARAIASPISPYGTIHDHDPIILMIHQHHLRRRLGVSIDIYINISGRIAKRARRRAALGRLRAEHTQGLGSDAGSVRCWARGERRRGPIGRAIYIPRSKYTESPPCLQLFSLARSLPLSTHSAMAPCPAFVTRAYGYTGMPPSVCVCVRSGAKSRIADEWIDRWIPVEGSWDGSDIASWHMLLPHKYVVLKRVLQTASDTDTNSNSKWEIVRMWANRDCGISHVSPPLAGPSSSFFTVYLPTTRYTFHSAKSVRLAGDPVGRIDQ